MLLKKHKIKLKAMAAIKIKDVMVNYYDENGDVKTFTMSEFEKFTINDEVVSLGVKDGWHEYKSTGYKKIQCKGKIDKRLKDGSTRTQH